MTSKIIADGKTLKLNPFITELTANIVDAVARSLKLTEGNTIQFRLKADEITLLVDENEVPLQFGSAARIVRDILKGLAKNLFGAENANEILLICDRTK